MIKCTPIQERWEKEPGVNKLVLVFIEMSRYSKAMGQQPEDITQDQDFRVLRCDAVSLLAMRKAVYCSGDLGTSEWSCIWSKTGCPKYSALAGVPAEPCLVPAASQTRGACNS